jgi:hypothetical protein
MLFEIKPYYQDRTQFCSIYAVVHCLMVQFSTQQKEEVRINPFRVMLDVFRYKKWPFLWNRSFSPHEVIAALKIYGVKIGDLRWYPTKLVEVPIEKITASFKAGIPLIATLSEVHELCIVDKFKAWNGDPEYTVIDSSSRLTPYRIVKNPKLTNFYAIL